VNATTLLDTPTGLTGEAVSLSQINLSWNAVSGASGYILQRSQLVSVNPVVVSEWENVNDYSSSTTHTDTGLNNPLRMYYYRIQAYGYAYDGASTIYSGYIDDNGDIHVLLPEK
jgi:hypothetical protein